MAVLGLRFCARASPSCGKRGPLFIVVCGPLTIAASLVAEHRLQTRRLSSCGPSCSAACGIFPDQGSNPCPLHWQADCQPLRHQGSPVILFLEAFIAEHAMEKSYILSISVITLNCEHLSITSDKTKKLDSGFQMGSMVSVLLNFLYVVKS